MLSVHPGLMSLHLERPWSSVGLSVSALYSVSGLMIHDPRESALRSPDVVYVTTPSSRCL